MSIRRFNASILLLTMAVACGGHSEETISGDGDTGSTGGSDNPDSTGGASTGGGASPSSGGATGGGGTDIVFSGGSESTGGDGAGGATACTAFSFWLMAADELIGGLGPCGPDECADGETPMGSITFGDTGEVIDFSSSSESTTTSFLETVDGETWPCLASQSSDYCCHPR